MAPQRRQAEPRGKPRAKRAKKTSAGGGSSGGSVLGGGGGSFDDDPTALRRRAAEAAQRRFDDGAAERAAKAAAQAAAATAAAAAAAAAASSAATPWESGARISVLEEEIQRAEQLLERVCRSNNAAAGPSNAVPPASASTLPAAAEAATQAALPTAARPAAAVAVAAAASAAPAAASDASDDEVEFVGVTHARFVHARYDCPEHPMAEGQHERYCADCWCAVCEVPVGECLRAGTWAAHCTATQASTAAAAAAQREARLRESLARLPPRPAGPWPPAVHQLTLDPRWRAMRFTLLSWLANCGSDEEGATATLAAVHEGLDAETAAAVARALETIGDVVRLGEGLYVRPGTEIKPQPPPELPSEPGAAGPWTAAAVLAAADSARGATDQSDAQCGAQPAT